MDSSPASTLPSHLICPKCTALKPRAEFKRILSRAQAKQVGYSGERRILITSSLCKTCQPKRRPAAKLSRKELINRIQGGDIHPFVGNAMLTKRQQVAHEKMTLAAQTAWDKARRQTWETPLQELQAERRRFQSVRDYRYKHGPQSLFHFSVTYLGILEHIKTMIAQRTINDERTGVRVAPYTDWEDYADAEYKAYLVHAWAQVPPADQSLLKHHPRLLTFGPELRRPPPAAPLRPAKKGEHTPKQETC